ncbi:ketohexokinase [Colletotrichum spaethianum]|uniref:Ketohexokinase n=1 Tax=Colletotrichum spaethianum TaxID=700344 RepID=A0AA37PBK0_9PEZI|nr:ketohexokinase [Colletotrichum spaethianum]GKT49253.1 ketohexokinase [Colletotrichum spaethianum]
MDHLILVGACYVDTVMRQGDLPLPSLPGWLTSFLEASRLTNRTSVPHFPEEDSKLRATSLRIRRGGNCPNTIEVLQQLLAGNPSMSCPSTSLRIHLVSPLPERQSQATAQIIASLDASRTKGEMPAIDFDHCLFREGHQLPASSYILRSEATGSRTIVNHNDLPEMTAQEFLRVAEVFRGRGRTWWHFEGRIPETTVECIRLLRQVLDDVTVSVEVEKPGRPGLRELAAEAEVVFYSKSWAEVRHPPAADGGRGRC